MSSMIFHALDVDREGMLYGARRSRTVVDEPGEVATIVNGTVEPADLGGEMHPFVAACRRECREETGQEPELLRIVGIAASSPKWQPSIIAVGKVTSFHPRYAAEDRWETSEFVPVRGEGDLSGLSRLVYRHVFQKGGEMG